MHMENTNINKVQSWASHSLSPTSPKPPSPTRRSGSRVLRGYCGAWEFVVPAHFIIGPKIQAKENDFRGREVKIQKRPKYMAEDDLMLGTSQNAWKKGQTQYRGSTEEKAANTIVWNHASDRPIPQTMLFNFFNHSQPLYVWIDRTGLYPKKQNLHVNTKQEVNTSIKGKESQGGSGSRKEDKSYKRGRGRILCSTDVVRGLKPYKSHRCKA